MDQQILKEGIEQLKSISEGIRNPWAVIIPLLGVIVALFLGILGIFQDWIRSLFRKPKLKISITMEPPDCHKISLKNVESGQHICDTYYFRFRIENTGNYKMEDAEAMVIEVYRKNNNKFIKEENFLPLNLVWAHYHYVTMSTIQPALFKHLDFGNIMQSQFENLADFGIKENPHVIFKISLAVIPNTGSHILLPGEYKIKIIFSANNLKPQIKTYLLVIKDTWTDDEREMLSKNVSIQEISS